MKNKKAFTLIELLIVIALIGILASIVLVSLSSARTKAQISKRQAFGETLAKALHACAISGGEITIPNSSTAPTNDLCSIASGTVWPGVLPGDMFYDTGQTYNTPNDANAVLLRNNDYSEQLWCGYFPPFSTFVTLNPALYTISQNYGCAHYSPQLYGDETWRSF